MIDRPPLPAPDEGFEEIFFADLEPSLVRFAAPAEQFANRFSDVRNLRIERVGRHEEKGWIIRFHAPIGEFDK